MDVFEMNMAARRLVLTEGQPIRQKIGYWSNAKDGAYTAGQALVLNHQLRNVGLIKRIYLECEFAVVQGAAETQTLSGLGGANALSKIVYSDLRNQRRIDTTGLHLHLLSTARRQVPFGSAATTDAPGDFGANYNIVKHPSPVTTVQTLYHVYELPFAYSDEDLRGAIFANVIGATQNLQVEINPNFFVASTGNDVQGVYKSSTAQLGSISSWTINIWMEYIDQLPRDQNKQYILPVLDLSWQYTLLNSSEKTGAVNSEQTLAFSNYRQYYSLFTVYDNGGTLNAGTDIDNFRLVTANSQELFNLSPKMLALLNGRNRIFDDWPAGVNYFPFRDRPLAISDYGNTTLNYTPTTVNTGAQMLVLSEYFIQQQVAPTATAIMSN